MSKTATIGDTVAKSFLLPGTIACNVLGLRGETSGDYTHLVRMLINSLVWTVAGVIVVAIVT
jgi:hypothetical protein